MSGFEHYFHSKPETATHPKVRFWKRMQQDGTRLVCELLRERDGLSFGPARLYIRFLDPNGRDRHTPDEVDWDARLNDELLRMRVKASDEESEIKRFGLTLRDRLEQPEERFGDGYFNAVLIEYIDKSPFAHEPLIREKRRFITAYRASRDGRAFTECWEALDSVIVRCAQDLTALDYEQGEAVRILSGALAAYLDERFSITNRRLLGFV
jgi:hypothetical protein